jgi:dTDP-D-glucose 4,6-dehydratase
LIQSLVPTAKLVDMGRDTDARNYRVSFSKIRRALDFVPKWSLENGVRQVMKALISGTVRDYKDSRYSNVKFLTDDRNSQLMRTTGWERKLIEEASSAQR